MPLNIQRLDFDPVTGDNPSEAFMKLDLDIGEISDAVDGFEQTLDGLGNAATKDIGITAGTVASGDDDRFLAGTRGLKNKLMNSSGVINNRRFGGGALAVGAFGYDRWKASATGTSVSCVSGLWTLNGALLQSMERNAANPLDNRVVTVSVEDPSGPINVRLSGNAATVSGDIPAGAGRQSVTLTMPPTTNAYNSIVLTTAGSQTYGNPQLEIGDIATPYEEREVGLEDYLCARYCPAFKATSNLSVIGMGQAATATQTTPVIMFKARARIPPTALVVSSGAHFSVSVASTANVTCTSVVFGSASADGAVVLTGGSSGLAAGNSTIFFFNNVAGWLYFEGCDF